MNLRFLLVSLPFCLSLLAACSKQDKPIIIEDPEIPESPYDTSSKLKVLWQYPMGADTFDYKSKMPALWGNTVCFTRIDFTAGLETLHAFDCTSGAPKWQWEPYIGHTYLTSAAQYKDHFLVSNFFEVYDLDITTGMVRWDTELTIGSQGAPRSTFVFDQAYHARGNEIIKDTVDFLVRTPLEYARWDTVLALNAVDGYRPSFEMPTPWILPTGDTILFFQNRQWNFPASDGKIDLWAYNLSQKEPLWVQYDIDPLGNSNILPPQVFENKVYICGQQTLYCFNAFTGQRLWKKEFPNDNVMVTGLLFAEGKLFMKPTNGGYLYALNPANGSEYYKTSNTGLSTKTLHYYKGNIYYCSQGEGKLYAVKASTGQVMWKEYSPNYYKGRKSVDRAFMTDELIIDPERNVLYTNDSFYFMAIKLPE